MAAFAVGTLYWLASGVGLFLIGYVLIRWRKSARACYPMPFRRRKGYLFGLLFAFTVTLLPLILRPDNCAGCMVVTATGMVADMVSN
ncbi:hypothetical protein [Hyphomonas oceanitis]|uniref:hypothetical protein n=1 Tax=Hyphomonas oceanitis TaxID=81033 RepID=UPI0012EBC275|nr:hypothetical protein [Hyphomonas oceanitis]